MHGPHLDIENRLKKMNRERLEELISDYLEQALTPEQLEELTLELRASPQARRRLLAAADQDLAVQDLARSLHRTATPARGRKPLGAWRSLRPPQTTPAYWAAALAAAGVLLAVTFFVASGPSGVELAKSEDGKGARARTLKEAEARRNDEREKAVRERDSREAEAMRRDREARLKVIEGRREELARSAAQPGEDPRERENRTAEEKRLSTDKERIEREMKEAAQQAKKFGGPTPTEQPDQEKPVPAQEPPKALQGTVATVATVERVEGDVSIVGKEAMTPARTNQGISGGQGVKTGPKSFIALKCPDGTRLELGAESVLREFADEGGKRLFVEKGTMKAQVSKQPKGQPMVIATPHGEATVLGTTLRLVVDPDPKKGTRLEVEEGKVELKNLTGKTVYVESRHYAAAAVGMEFVAKSLDSSTNVPRQGMALWFRSNQGVALNGSSVSAWADLSGNNRHAVQPVRAQQPTFVHNAIQGHPALRFDGVDDCLCFPCPVTGLSGMTIFLVAATAEELTAGSPGAGNAAIYWNQMDMNFGGIVVTPYSAKVNFYFGTGQPQPILSYSRPASLARGYSLSTTLKNGSEAVLFVNGRESLRVGGQNLPLSKCEEIGQIGRGEGDQQTNRQFPGQREGWTYFSGEIAEVIVYTCALPEFERMSVEQYLLSKYILK
jgi:hypothetical protein